MSRTVVAFLVAASLSAGCFEAPVEYSPEDSVPRSFIIVDGGPFGASDAGSSLDAGQPFVHDAGSPPNLDGGCPSCFAPTSGSIVGASLPYNLHESAAFYDGQKVWLLGGNTDNNVRTNGILSFDPATGTVTQHPNVLPYAQAGAYYASTGTVLYLFGGDTGNGLRPDVVRFDSSTQTVTTKAAQMPSPRYNGAAVWVGPYIYLVGGWNGYAPLAEIIRYDTVNDRFATLSTALPASREEPAVVVANGYLYVASGNSGIDNVRSSVVRLDVTTGSLTTLPTSNPLPRAFTGSASDGQSLYLFGGMVQSSWSGTDVVVRFDPATESFSNVGTLATAKHGDPWVWVDNRFVSFGGMNVPPWKWFNIIQQWTPPSP